MKTPSLSLLFSSLILCSLTLKGQSEDCGKDRCRAGTILYYIDESNGEPFILIAEHINKNQERGWSTLGGCCNEDENEIQAAVRETYEETAKAYSKSILTKLIKPEDSIIQKNKFVSYIVNVAPISEDFIADKVSKADPKSVYEEMGNHTWVKLSDLEMMIDTTKEGEKVLIKDHPGITGDSLWLYDQFTNLIRTRSKKIREIIGKQIKEPGQDDNPEENNSDNELDDLKKRIKVLEAKADRKELPKFSLSPSKSFQAFSFGANFDLLDGTVSNSLYSDILVNLGVFDSDTKTFGNRLSLQFGTVRGRSASQEFNSIEDLGSDLIRRSVDSLMIDPMTMDTTAARLILEPSSLEEGVTQDDQLNVYARFNYLLSDSKTSKIKIYFVSQFEYSRVKSEISGRIKYRESSRVDIPVGSFRGTPRNAFIDSLEIVRINSFLFPSTGFTTFASTDTFDFSYSFLLGYRLIAFKDNTQPSRNSFGYIIQGSILEKSAVGAKLGFELRYFPEDLTKEPSYFFYIAKQFSLSEFFKIFSPTSK